MLRWQCPIHPSASRRLTFLTGLVSLLLVSVTALLAQQPANSATPSIDALRGQARSQQQQGHWQEALKIHRQLLAKTDDAESGLDLENALKCIRELQLNDQYDSLFRSVLKQHNKNWRVIATMAVSYEQLSNQSSPENPSPFINPSGDDESAPLRKVSALADHHRALQLYEKAMHLAAAAKAPPAQRADLIYHFADSLSQQGYSSMQKLTELDAHWVEPLPARQQAVVGNDSANKQAVNLFYSLPSTWAKARSDGERWRWLINKASKLDPSRKDHAQFRHARLLMSYYDVAPLLNSARSESERQQKQLRLSQLKNNESLFVEQAKTFNGRPQIHPITLPGDQCYIQLLQNAAEIGGDYADQACHLLVEEFLTRQQRHKAAHVWQQAITKHGKGKKRWRSKQLERIIGDWGKFEPLDHFITKGTLASIDLNYRNASSAQLRIYRFDSQSAIKKLLKYLGGNPRRIREDLEDLEEIEALMQVPFGQKFLGVPIHEWTIPLSPARSHQNRTETVKLPIQQAGWYLVEAQLGPSKRPCRIIVPIIDLAIIRREQPGYWLYSMVDVITGQPVPHATFTFSGLEIEERERVSLFGRRHDIRLDQWSLTANGQGILKIPHKQFESNSKDADEAVWLTQAEAPDGRSAWLNWMDQESYIGELVDRDQIDKFIQVYGVTDRPIYRPSQKMQLKFWLGELSRQGKNKVRANQKYRLEVRRELGKGQQETEKVFAPVTSDEWGGIEQTWSIPEDGKLGAWSAVLLEHRKKNNENRQELGSVSFRVEAYRKPEFEVSVKTQPQRVYSGKKFTTTIEANYLHGAPLRQGRVDLKITRVDGRSYLPQVIHHQTHPLNSDGQFSLQTKTEQADHNEPEQTDQAHRPQTRQGMRVYYQIEAIVTDAAERVVGAHSWLEVATAPFQVSIQPTQHAHRPGEKVTLNLSSRNLDGDAIPTQGKLRLFQVTYGKNQKERRTQVHEQNIRIEGASQELLELKRGGTYQVEIEVNNNRGEKHSASTRIIVSGGGTKDYHFSNLKTLVHRDSYRPKETSRLLLCAPKPGGTAMVFIRSGKSEQIRIITMPTAVSELQIPLRSGDLPNLELSVWWVGQGQFDTCSESVDVALKHSPWTMTLTPDSNDKPPGSKGTVSVKLTDAEGLPVEGAVTLTVYDKALDALVQAYGYPNMMNALHQWPLNENPDDFEHSFDWYGHGFSPEGGDTMPALERHARWYGNGSWGNAPPVMLGGGTWTGFSNRTGSDFISPVSFTSIPGIPASAGAYVSNIATAGLRSGDFATTRNSIDAILNNPNRIGHQITKQSIRSTFADLVHWQGRIITNKEGKATLEFNYPDNLTTWMVRAWAMGKDLHCAEASTEVVTRKKLLIRVQTPRFFTETDEIELSAIIHNESDKELTVEASLNSKNNTLGITSKTRHLNIQIPARSQRRVVWMTQALSDGQADLSCEVSSGELSDVILLKVPVQVHGVARQQTSSSAISPQQKATKIPFHIPEKRQDHLSALSIQLSPTLVSSVIDAIPYLADYPYGCTEQTMNRFVPAVIARAGLKKTGFNLKAIQQRWQQQQFTKKRSSKSSSLNPVFDQKQLELMTKLGCQRLWTMQNSDGGWGWFSGSQEQSTAHTTAVVLHGLLKARDAGIKVKAERINAAVEWLRRHENKELSALRLYAKIPRGQGYRKAKTSDLDALVHCILGEVGVAHPAMTKLLLRDKIELSVYGKCLLGHELHRLKNKTALAAVLHNISQYQQIDPQKKTLWLQLPPSHAQAWSWSADGTETQAWYLSLLTKVNPKGKQARQLANHLISSRKFSRRWKSTRATGYCIEALINWVMAAGETSQEIDAEIWLNGQHLRSVRIDAQAADFGSVQIKIEPKLLTTGDHLLEIRRKTNSQESTLYTQVSLTVFNQQSPIPAASGQLSVQRRYFKVLPLTLNENEAEKNTDSTPSPANNIQQIQPSETITAGDIIEVELEIENKHSAEYLLLEDRKPAGFEPISPVSGYYQQGNLLTWVEFRDKETAMMIDYLPKGSHLLRYRLRAEMSGTISALPASFEAMYAPELKSNSSEKIWQVKAKAAKAVNKR